MISADLTHLNQRLLCGSPAEIRTPIHGSKGRCPTIRRPGNCSGQAVTLSVYPTILEILAGAVQERHFHSKFCTAWSRFDNLNEMASLQRPGEITYYEELGVENTASADEIRDAFRALARLLHPDQQTDPQLKEIAERQMRKLNRIYGVLSDVSRRTAYDDSLRASRNAPIIVFSGSDGSVKKLLVRGGAAGAIVFGTFLLIWFMVTSNNECAVRNPAFLHRQNG